MEIKPITNKDITIAVPQKTDMAVFDPDKDIERAESAARSLMRVVKRKKNPVIVNGEQYIEYEDWMTVGRFYGATVGVEWTKPIMAGGKVVGYEARSVVYQRGEIVSAAEAMCTREEPNWKTRPEFMLRSMAQTRASAKALRNVFAYVVVLAGLKPTPAEEMDGVRIESPKPIPKNAEELKGRIMLLVRELKINPKTKKEWEEIVLDMTDLPLLPENYQEIISRLSVRLKEK